MINENLITTFTQIFVNRWDIWYGQKCNGSGRYKCFTPGKHYYKPLTVAEIAEHLIGNLTIALPAVNDCFLSKWCAWDEDVDIGVLDSIKVVLQQMEINWLQVTGRPGRKGHLFIPFDRPLPRNELWLFRAEVQERAGLGQDVPHLDFFPGHVEGLSQIRAPLGINRKNEAGWSQALSLQEADRLRGWFADCPSRSIEPQLQWLQGQLINSWKSIQEPIAERKRLAQRQRRLEQAGSLYLLQPKHRRSSSSFLPIAELIKMLEIPTKKQGQQLSMRCPLCAEAGEDLHGDNLKVRIDNGKFCCVEGGPGAKHSSKAIYHCLLRKAKQIGRLR